MFLTIDYPDILQRDTRSESRYCLRVFSCESDGVWFELANPSGDEEVLYNGNDIEELKRVIKAHEDLNFSRTAFAP